MAHYVATVSTPRPFEDVLHYMTDFRCVADWDPSIESCTLTGGDDPRAVGARFHVAMKKMQLDYEVTAVTGDQVTLRGENSTLVSIDKISVKAVGTGCEVTYDAALELQGWRKLGEPLLRLMFGKIGDNAKDGLRRQLSGQP